MRAITFSRQVVAGAVMAAAVAGLMIVAGAAPSSASDPGYGSLLVTVNAPVGGPVDGYCLKAVGPPGGAFTTAGSGTDGTQGQINQFDVLPGAYIGQVFDCGGGGGYTSKGNVRFSVTAGALTQFVLQLVSGGSVVGNLVDSSTGGAAPFVPVTAYDATKFIAIASGCTDQSGSYSFSGLPLSPGVKLQFGGAGTCGNGGTYVGTWYGGTTFGTATAVTPQSTCCGTQLGASTVTPANPSRNGSVTITSVAFGGTSANPTFTVAGSGFATTAHSTKPVCTETAGAGRIFGTALYLNDNSSAPWQAGTGNDCIGLVVGSWTDTSISFTLGSWYATTGAAQGTVLRDGDPYTMVVRGAHFTGTVSGLS